MKAQEATRLGRQKTKKEDDDLTSSAQVRFNELMEAFESGTLDQYYQNNNLKVRRAIKRMLNDDGLLSSMVLEYMDQGHEIGRDRKG